MAVCIYIYKMLRSKSGFPFHSDLTVCLGVVSSPLFSLEKYSSETGGVDHMHRKSECGRHIRHRNETSGLSVGSDRVDTRKIPGMLRKHGSPGSQTEEEGNKGIRRAWKPTYTNSHKSQNHNFPNQYKDYWNSHYSTTNTG